MKARSSHFAKIRTPMLMALALTYFGFHLMNGERGVYAYFKETHRDQILTEEYARVKAEREQMELRVSGLRNDSLDLDLLDEQARNMLGMSGKDEHIVLHISK